MHDELKYRHVLGLIYSSLWAILPSKLDQIIELVAYRAEGGYYSEEEIQARIGAARSQPAPRSGAVAVIPVYGTIIPRGNMLAESSGATSVQTISASLREALNDSRVSSILLDVDSPGGTVTGVDELSAEIFRARGQKPITAIASPMAASAAYYIASAADELVVTPTGEVGSIGVFAAHQDMSRLMDRMGVTVSLVSAGKYKTEGNPYEPLSDEARAALQDRVDEYYNMFVDAVARNRGMSSDKVRNGMGEGRVVSARRALSLGMADRVATMDEIMQQMTGRARKPGTSAESDSLRLRAKALAARGRGLTT